MRFASDPRGSGRRGDTLTPLTPNEELALSALAGLYERMDENSGGDYGCRMCGSCCHFNAYGHRLYASRIEALYLFLHNGAPRFAFSDDACGYQDGAACAAREGRVLGCRSFFCRRSDSETSAIHEEALAEVRAITARYGLAWDYQMLSQHWQDESRRRRPRV